MASNMYSRFLAAYTPMKLTNVHKAAYQMFTDGSTFESITPVNPSFFFQKMNCIVACIPTRGAKGALPLRSDPPPLDPLDRPLDLCKNWQKMNHLFSIFLFVISLPLLQWARPTASAVRLMGMYAVGEMYSHDLLTVYTIMASLSNATFPDSHVRVNGFILHQFFSSENVLIL